jgi:hypothetical protein
MDYLPCPLKFSNLAQICHLDNFFGQSIQTYHPLNLKAMAAILAKIGFVTRCASIGEKTITQV